MVLQPRFRQESPVAPSLQVRELHPHLPLVKQRIPSYVFHKVYDCCTFLFSFSLEMGCREVRRVKELE